MSARVFVLPKAVKKIGETLDALGFNTTALRGVQLEKGGAVIELMRYSGAHHGRDYYERMDGSVHSHKVTTLLTPERA